MSVGSKKQGLNCQFAVCSFEVTHTLPDCGVFAHGNCKEVDTTLELIELEVRQ